VNLHEWVLEKNDKWEKSKQFFTKGREIEEAELAY
jgi:hypothetical protein